MTGWDRAIEDAKKHIDRLKMVVRVFEKKKATAGEPWPDSTQKAS
jgi:hypothetical protein